MSSDTPKRPRARTTAAWFMLLIGAIFMAVWLARLAISDRFISTQFFAWPPAWTLLAPSAIASLLGAAIAPIGRTRVGAVIFALVPALTLLLGPWRLGNLATRHEPERSLVLVFWNAAPSTHAEGEQNMKQIATFDGPERADIIVVSNPGALRWSERFERATGRSPTHAGTTDFISPLPVIRSGPVPVPTYRERRSIRMGFAVLDTSEALPGTDTLTIWSIDLPSDRSLPRREVAGVLRDAIAEVRSRGHEQLTPPVPDLIVGDFNMPRGSASIALFTEGLTDAHTAAGLGPSGTWPVNRPFLHIDQAFVGNGWRATKHDVLPVDIGTHRALRIVLAPND
ncbi:MAG: endonuclease/exonuclease/phosphatase family protein [Planctomycetota bacterium]